MGQRAFTSVAAVVWCAIVVWAIGGPSLNLPTLGRRAAPLPARLPAREGRDDPGPHTTHGWDSPGSRHPPTATSTSAATATAPDRSGQPAPPPRSPEGPG
eukprot:gene7675-7149_t